MEISRKPIGTISAIPWKRVVPIFSLSVVPHPRRNSNDVGDHWSLVWNIARFSFETTQKLQGSEKYVDKCTDPCTMLNKISRALKQLVDMVCWDRFFKSTFLIQLSFYMSFSCRLRMFCGVTFTIQYQPLHFSTKIPTISL